MVVGIGELLWDVFPEGMRLGGAPLNFAYHCRQLGALAHPVSAVGRDMLGREIRHELSARGIDDAFVEEDSRYPTGTVQVTLDAYGKPTYEICEGVAWDAIPITDGLAELAKQADAACYGTLAQRNPVSRATIHAFLHAMRPDALRIYDINLRQEFYTKETIESSLQLCNVLKLNDDELPVLAEMFGLKGSVQDQLATLINGFDLKLIAYTRGKDGSLLVTPDGWNDCPGTPVDVIDSVGAGDSFTAALCMGMLRGQTLSDVNEHANRVAAFVCSQAGATPQFTDTIKN